MTLDNLIAHIKNLQEKELPKPQKKQSKVVKLIPKYIENDLRLMVNTKGGSYKSMKSEGVIINVSDYI